MFAGNRTFTVHHVLDGYRLSNITFGTLIHYNMNHKLFISHSSTQKPFVEELIDYIGHDYAVVDKYTFESGEDLWEEIQKAIDECDFFVYLISKEALDSAWVNREIGYVRDKIDEDSIIFCPVIIDDTVNINHSGIKSWIKKSFLVDSIVHPHTLARLLKKEIRRSVWEKFPDLKAQSHLFLGREEEMHALTENFFSNYGVSKLALIVSGLPHIGRKRLLREFIASKIIIGGDASDFIDVRMTDKDSIQEFAIQLNDIVEEYSYNELLDRMVEKDGALSTTVHLLNRLHEIKEFVIINDDKCIVRGDGILTDWFVDIINHRSLKTHLHLNVASRFTPRPNLCDVFPSVFTFQLHPLKPNDMRTLFNVYAAKKGIEVSSRDIDYFIERFAGYPEQVMFTVDTLNRSNMALAKKAAQNIVSKFDNNYHSIIVELKTNERDFQVLVLLSYFEFISYDYLCYICGEDITDVLERFHYYSLTESFGIGKQYICLNSAVVDYIKRTKFQLSPKFKKKLREMTSEALANMDDNISDISYRLYAVKELLREGTKVDERYLIPSFVLKVITEEYYNKHDDTVISLADRILKGYHTKAYEDVVRSITYWLCCALCRQKNKRFFEEVRYFENSPYSYYFLNGFYYRHIGDYQKAKLNYQEALTHTREYDEDSYASKAEHEMVIVCMRLGDYSEALSLAKHSYEKNPSNSYHIEAYFRCFVRSAHPDAETIKTLMSQMNKSFDSNRAIIYETMLAEYNYYIRNDYTGAIESLCDIIKNNLDMHTIYPLQALRDICVKHDSMPIYKSMAKLCRKLSQDFLK